jgi:transposase
MIAVPAGMRVLVWSSPVDFRKGMDGLSAHVQVTLKADAFAGDLFVFRSRRADRIKVLMYDGTGLCLYQKRLERGRFRWPPMTEGTVRLSAAQMAALLEGLEWSKLRPHAVPRPQVAC